MTRGTFFFITDNGVIESVEFNGSMYERESGGYGDDAFEMLQKVKTSEQFSAMVKEFNQTHHDYKDEQLIYSMNIIHKDDQSPGFFDEPEFVDFTRDYFARFFSDYLFIKNASSNTIHFKTRWQTSDNTTPVEEFDLKERGTVVINFGRFVKIAYSE